MAPKRIIDGEGLWRSDRLARIEPPEWRAEYANLLPLAMANGVFEANPRRIWATVYAFNRPGRDVEDVAAILNELERVKILFRWTDPGTGKTWGYWIGSDKPGRLPGPSRRGTNEAIGPTPPTEELRKFLESDKIQQLPNGNENLLGFGFGLGSGSGKTSGEGEIEQPSDDRDVLIDSICKLHPRLQKQILTQQLIVSAAFEEVKQHQGWNEQQALTYLHQRTQIYRQATDQWPADQRRYIMSSPEFYRSAEYRTDEKLWEKANAGGECAVPVADCPPLPADYVPVSQRLRALDEEESITPSSAGGKA